MYIRIVESSELRPDLSLRASDYLNQEGQMNAVTQRLETGKQLPTELLENMETIQSKVPALAVDQLWEITDNRKPHSPKVRTVKILGIGDTHALVENIETRHVTEVRLSAFNGRTKKSYRPANNGS